MSWFLSGDKVYLGDPTGSDSLEKMTDDREAARFMTRGWKPGNKEDFWRAFKERKENGDVEFGIFVADLEAQAASLPAAGLVGLHNIQWIPRSAEFRIALHRGAWGKGYGTEATMLAVAYGFEILNLHKVWLGVVAANEAAVHIYEKVGFQREGVLRDEVYRNREYYDAIRMSVLRNEYDQLRNDWPIAAALDEQFPQTHTASSGNAGDTTGGTPPTVRPTAGGRTLSAR